MMRHLSLRMRVLLAALLPAVLVAVGLASAFVARHIDDLEAAMVARGRAEARQLANAAEFGLFSGNQELLERLVRNAGQGDAEITATAILGTRGVSVVRSGTFTVQQWPAADGEHVVHGATALLVAVPIRRELLAVDDIYSGLGDARPGSAIVGQVVMEFTLEPLQRERRDLLALVLGVTLGGLLLAGLLAARIARGMTRPVLHMSEVVSRIAAGDLEARVTPDPSASMPRLEKGINEMAAHIASAQLDLKAKVAAATAELRARKDEAESATAAKTRFLAAASHDLRQPMHALGLFVSRLSRLDLGHEAHGVVRYIESSVAALQDLLDALLDISRIDAGLVVPKIEAVSVDVLFERLSAEADDGARRKGLRFRRRGGRGLVLRTDAVLIERILTNLLANAVNYTRAGGVLLSCRKRGDTARIEVWDTGIGIPEEARQAIFDEYVQLGNPERDRSKGLGLGLSICERLARLLCMPLWLRSDVGRGSVFRLDVPLASEAAAAAVDHAAPTGEGGGGDLAGTVLIIDDDPLVKAGTADLVAAWGCRVIAGSSIADVLADCAAFDVRPDVAICDYRLRGLENGVNSARVLRRRFGEIPVLMLSGDLGDELKREAAREGYTLLAKPLRPARLRALLQHLLGGA